MPQIRQASSAVPQLPFGLRITRKRRLVPFASTLKMCRFESLTSASGMRTVAALRLDRARLGRRGHSRVREFRGENQNHGGARECRSKRPAALFAAFPFDAPALGGIGNIRGRLRRAQPSIRAGPAAPPRQESRRKRKLHCARWARRRPFPPGSTAATSPRSIHERRSAPVAWRRESESCWWRRKILPREIFSVPWKKNHPTATATPGPGQCRSTRQALRWKAPRRAESAPARPLRAPP